MGQRSASETVTAILVAFLESRTWSQSDLARRLEMSTAALRKHLEEIRAAGIRLEREAEHPQVYWTVPKGWFPNGVTFTGDQVVDLYRQLSRLPGSRQRDRLLETIVACLPGGPSKGGEGAPALVASPSEREEMFLPVIEDAARFRAGLRFRYFSAARGSEGIRHASVHRVSPGPPARFLATCHRNGALKWFRVEGVSDPRPDPAEPFRSVADAEVDAFVRASLDGFHQGGAAIAHAFFVSEPEARWVSRNLLDDMRAEEAPNGIRVTLETSAVQRLARFVVGLGAAAKPLTPLLATDVTLLAEGARPR